MRQTYPDSPDEDPYYIHQGADASACRRLLYHPAAKRPKGQRGKLQRLNAEGDAYYSDHQQNAANEILDGYDEASENEPNNVS